MKKLFIPSIIVMGVSTLTPCLVACGDNNENKIRTITLNDSSGTEGIVFNISKTSFTQAEMKKGFEIEIECTDYGSISTPIFWVSDVRTGNSTLSKDVDYTVEYDQEVWYFGNKLTVKIGHDVAINNLTIDVRVEEYSQIPILTKSNETTAILTVSPNGISDIRTSNKYNISISEGNLSIDNVWLGYSQTPWMGIDFDELESWPFRKDQHYALTDVKAESCSLNFTGLGVQILNTYLQYATEVLVIEWSKK